jgi:hypothetical protein
MNTIHTFVTSRWTAIKSSVTKTVEEIKSSISGAWDGISEKVTTVLNTLDSLVSTTWGTIESTVSSAVENVRSSISSGFEEAKSTVTSVFETVASTISEKMNAAKETVSSVVEAIKGFFNFEFTWPHIPLPHINYTLIEVPVLGTIPDPTSLSIDWYAKAMKDGMILNNPTIFGMMNGHLLAGGEAGSETVVGTSSLMNMIQAAVKSAQPNNTYGDLIVNVTSYGTDATTIADEIGEALNRKLRMSGGW